MNRPALITDSSLTRFVRIRVTGQDRARFLHSFCTNNILELNAGQAREVFFTSRKARILAHGYILAGLQDHEIWMLPGDEDSLIGHLERYIITEDVQLESRTGPSGTPAIISGDIPEDKRTPEPNSWRELSEHGPDSRVLTVSWSGTRISFACGPSLSADHPAPVPPGTCTLSADEFHHRRIQERFPIIGQDLTEDHLAPEALRNQSAISYTKGCYLGQEPIARLDALGQVNRVLARIDVHSQPAGPNDIHDAVVLTSYCSVNRPPVGLAVVPVRSLKQPSITVRLPDGTLRTGTIAAPTAPPGDNMSS